MARNNLFNCRRWIIISLTNFFVVSVAGVILRYKINFPLPFIDQKFLLHGHSHFAFVGWVSLALMSLMVNYLTRSGVVTNYKKYHALFIINTISAYGMLIAFTAQGYALFSITFSMLSIFVSYFFIFYYWKDLNRVSGKRYITNWFKFALLLLGISSMGPFALAYLMASHIFVQDLYFSAIYFFLHFQYNGWFLFACFGLLFSFVQSEEDSSVLRISKRLFIILASTVLPSYLLSILGLKVPAYLHWIAASSAIIQLSAVFYNHRLLQEFRSKPDLHVSKTTGYLWTLAWVSFALKIVLQGFSVVPYFADFAFSLRPAIVGYLHLCFLGVISFFILGCCNIVLGKVGRELSKPGLLVFVSGVLVQEVALMVQALDAITFKAAVDTGIILLLAAVAMAAGLAITLIKAGHFIKGERPL
jgi:hypothetical protein